MNIDIWLLVGISGMICILFGFLMIQMHRWTQDDFVYDALNFAGSTMLVMYAIVGRAWPFIILNVIWAVYSLRDLPGDLLRKKSMTRRSA